jgi:molecular chaperone GrpE (heat shock protein)
MSDKELDQATPEPAPHAGVEALLECQQALADCQRASTQCQESLLRAHADLDNQSKRTARELEKSHK